MTDERNNEQQPGMYDDDRLLACALGLDEDRELQKAAADDGVLAGRLDAMRADVERIGAQVSAAVPEPDDSYTDLSGKRWGGLQEFFEAPAVAAPQRKRRWWQVVAPVAAVLVIALIVGIVALQNGGHLPGSSSGSGSAPTEADAGSAHSSGGGAAKSPDEDENTVDGGTLTDRFGDQLDRFAVVVLARARQVSGAVQKFAVLRIFKGQAPKVVELAVGDEPADQGRLHLLMLDPTEEPEPTSTPTSTPTPTSEATAESPWALTGSPPPDAESPWPSTGASLPAETLSPEPIPSLADAGGPGEPLAVSYMYKGEPTMVRELAAGTDPDTVDLQIP
jgi:hypothetical protein